MSVFVKICGITRLEDALCAVEAGADALGFNFHPKSPRFIEPDRAGDILEEIPPAIARVGVFVNEKESFIVDVTAHLNLDVLQFHGDETPFYCEQFATPYWKAFGLHDEHSLELMKKYHPEAYLVDAFDPEKKGGTGKKSDWELAKRAVAFGKVLLAGGLNPDNVAEAVLQVRPWGVDVASGVEESPGIKDPKKIRAFLDAAKGVE